MKNFVVVSVLFLLIGVVSAWDTVEECTDSFYVLEDDFFVCEHSLRICRADYGNQTQYVDDLKLNLTLLRDSLTHHLNTTEKWRYQHEKCALTLEQVEDQATHFKQQNTMLLEQQTQYMMEIGNYTQYILTLNREFDERKDKLDAKLEFLNDEIITYKNRQADAERKHETCETRLEDARIKNLGTCNEYFASHYYSKWETLSPHEKECLAEVIKRDRIAFATTDMQDSIFTVCGVNIAYAVAYLEKYLELGFIERDPHTSFQVDTDKLDSSTKRYFNIAGVYNVVDFPRGCVTRFTDMDNVYTTGKNWGTYTTLFWIVSGVAISIFGRSIIERIISNIF